MPTQQPASAGNFSASPRYQGRARSPAAPGIHARGGNHGGGSSGCPSPSRSLLYSMSPVNTMRNPRTPHHGAAGSKGLLPAMGGAVRAQMKAVQTQRRSRQRCLQHPFLPALHSGRRISSGCGPGTAIRNPKSRLGVRLRTRGSPWCAPHLHRRPPAARLSWRSRSPPPRRCAPSPAAPAGTRPPPGRFSGGEAGGEAPPAGRAPPCRAGLGPRFPPSPVPRYLPSRCQGPIHVEEAQHPAPRRRHPAAHPASGSRRRDRAEAAMAAAPPSRAAPHQCAATEDPSTNHHPYPQVVEGRFRVALACGS